jgi:voltage-gated potassium channel
LGKRPVFIVLLGIGVILGGTLGYALLEGWGFLDALYMTVITITTVGFQEIHPLSPLGKVFTMLLVGSSLFVITYAVSYFVDTLAEGKWKEYLQRREMKMAIQSLRNHYIICGCGVVGREVIEYFTRARANFVVIERDLLKIQEALQSFPGFPYLLGDATREENLREAQIEHARGLLALVGNDPDNVYIVLTAKYLNPHLRIVARAIIPESIEIMKKAGADYVICPQKIGGLRLAAAALRPHVSSFLDLILRSEALGLTIEEVEIPSSASLVGKSLQELDLPGKMGLFVVAIKSKGTSSFELSPNAQTVIQAEDVLILLGKIDRILEFQKSMA